MYQQVRLVPVYRWLFALAATLSITAFLHAAVVYASHAPTAWLLLHTVTTLGLWLFGELRRQEWKRGRVQGEMRELVAAAERR